MIPARSRSALLALFLLTAIQSSCKELHLVVQVIDGDTIIINYKGAKETVRLIGVDTPETVHPKKPVEHFGREASAFTRKYLSGKLIRLEFDQAKRDKYKRLLAYIHLPRSQIENLLECMVKAESGEEIDFNASLISCGYGFAYTRFPFQRMEQYRKLERKARQSNRGLWSDRYSKQHESFQIIHP